MFVLLTLGGIFISASLPNDLINFLVGDVDSHL